jgi:hypothetical protein
MRILRAIVLVTALPLGLTGCGTFFDGANSLSDRFSDAMHDFNPFGTAKKPLPGERRPVFPDGVPGVQQGIPPDLMRHNQQAADNPEQTPGVAQPPPAAEEQPRATAAKSQPPRKTVRRARSTTAIEPEPGDPPEDGVWPPPPGRR